MKIIELRQMIREEIKKINESNKPNIVAIFPGENSKNPHMFYYEDKEDGQIYYVSGKGRNPVAVADDISDFKKLIKMNKINATLIK
jgi:hypothetical protein